MKRYRITARDAPQHLMLFRSAEALLVWLSEVHAPADEVIEFNLRLEDFMDVELIGFEYTNEGEKSVCLNLINVAYAHITENESGHTISSHLCWISDAVFPLRDSSEGSLTIRRLQDDEGIKLEHPLSSDED